MKALIALSILVISMGSYAQSTETVELNWKKMKDWKKKSHQEQSGSYLTEYLKKGESFDNWSELIAIQRFAAPGAMKVPLETLMNSGFSEFKKNAPNATLTFIEKDESTDHPWIEYKSEASSYLNDPNPESQFYRVIKTENSVFLIWWATKKVEISNAEIEKFQDFFRTAMIR